jgi:hypothetical protein
VPQCFRADRPDKPNRRKACRFIHIRVTDRPTRHTVPHWNYPVASGNVSAMTDPVNAPNPVHRRSPRAAQGALGAPSAALVTGETRA